jgi:hypothetical protein
LFLRACLRAAGRPSGIEEADLRRAFHDWHILHIDRESIPSDTREMDALVAVIAPPVPSTLIVGS